MFRETSNFKDFFQDHFFRLDRKYVDISMKNILHEMAVPLDIAKLPIKPDKDDIEFLHQFPTKYWTQALHQRYSEDFADALDELKTRRAPVEKKLYGRLKLALHSGNYNSLQGVISAELMTRLNNGQYGHVVGEDELTDQAATKLAELETEKAVPHIVWPPADSNLIPGYKRYKFKKSRNSSEVVTVVAKPFINRLFHKLGRTRDHEHHPESGLPSLGMTHGQYGYDLYDLKRGEEDNPHATRGMRLPMPQEVGSRLRDYLAHNSHRMYGDLPETGDDIVWKPVGDGRSIFKDNWSWKKVFDPLYSDFMSKLQTAEPGEFQLPDGTKIPPAEGFATNSERTAAARKLANAEVIKKAEAGEIKGPPIPGIAPEGLPVRVKVVRGEKKIDAPPLYLPHKKGQKIRVETADGVTTKTEDIPLINPAQYLRQLGSEDGDESIGEDQLRGHQKDYVHVPHNEYRKAKGYVASGSLHVNQNSGGRLYLDPSDPDYMDKKTEIEEGMGTCSLNKDNRPVTGSGEGTYFYDIIKGIWNCINSQSCGGATEHEKAILRDSVTDLHTMVYQRMMMNLRDEKLETAQGRRKFAKGITANWAQQDLGKGGDTRRKRRLTEKGRTMSLDATATGGSGDSLSLADSIQSNMKSALARDHAPTDDPNKRGQGDRVLPAGAGQFSYHLDNYRKIIEDMEKEAAKIDEDRETAVKMSKQEISDQIADLIGDAITDKAALVMQLQFYLKHLFISSGYPENEAEGLAFQKIEQYSDGRTTARQIIANFKADNNIQQMMQQPDSEAQPQSALAQGEVEKIEQIIDQMDDAGTMNDPTAQDKVYEFIRAHVPKEAQAACIAVADEQFGRQSAQPQPAPVPKASVPVATAAPASTQQANDLMRSQNWLGLAQHPAFLRKADADRLTKLIVKLEAAMAALPPDSWDHDEHQFAISRLRTKLKEKQTLGPIT